MKNQNFINRLAFAFQGIKFAFQTEASFRQQWCAVVAVAALLIWQRPPLMWTALLVMNCGLVIAAELFNTALETLIDHLHPDIHPAIKRAKDCAAGAVLILSLMALCFFLAYETDTILK